MTVESPPSFNTKHWALFILILLLIMAGCAYGGFLAGQRLTQAEQQSTLDELNGQNARLKAELDMAQQKLNLIAGAQAPLSLPAATTTNDAPTAENTSIENFSMPPDSDTPANCASVEQKIQQIEKQMKGTGSAIVYDSNEAWQEQQRQRQDTLAQQLGYYQQRLSHCE